MNRPFQKIILSIVLLVAGASALRAESGADPRVAVKLNAPIVIGIVNPAVEVSLGSHLTLNTELFGCFYRDGFAFIKGRAEMALAFVEPRWYFKSSYKGFFAAPNVGYGVWNLSKSAIPFIYGGAKTNYNYQVGSNLMCGVTLGYMFTFSSHWGMELSVGGGYSLSYYEGHTDKDGSMFVGQNCSSEWIPYKGAVSVVYRW